MPTAQGYLTQYINREFYQQYTSRYNGKDQKFRTEIFPKPEYANYRDRREQEEDHRDRNRDRRQQDNQKEIMDRQNRPTTPMINMISGGLASGGDTHKERRRYLQDQIGSAVMNVRTKRPRTNEEISFSENDQGNVIGPHDDAIVLDLKINTHRVRMILVDTGSSANILYLTAFQQMGYDTKNLRKIHTPLIGFTGNTLKPEGLIQLRVEFGTLPRVTSVMTDFLVVDAPSAYNAILGRSTLNAIGAVISPSHLKLKFQTDKDIGEECGHQQTARECYMLSLQEKGATVNQVDKQKHKDLDAVIREIIDMTPGQEIVLDPKDKLESGTQLEPANEVDQIDIGEESP